MMLTAAIVFTIITIVSSFILFNAEYKHKMISNMLHKNDFVLGMMIPIAISSIVSLLIASIFFWSKVF